MQHDLHIEGPAFTLRPVVLEDSERIVQLRSDADRTRYMHAVPNDVEAQRQWLRRYFERSGDYYFAVMRNRSTQIEGFVGIYDVREDEQGTFAEWGRWILRRESMAAAESAWLIFRLAFERLHLGRVFSRTLPENSAVVSFLDRCSPSDRRLVKDCVELQGITHDAVEHVLYAPDFPKLRAALEPLVVRLAQRLNSGAG